MQSSQNHEEAALLNRRTAIASVVVAVFLIALKTYASIQTGSVAMLGSLADSSLDLFASLVTLFGVVYAAQPADANHRFGHGKAEALAALFQVVLISFSAAAIAWRSVEDFLKPEPVAAPEAGIIVSLLSIAATFALLAYQRATLRKTSSLAIGADHVHYQSDLLLNVAVIVALALSSWFSVGWADPVFGFAIAAWLVFGAWRSASASVNQLMDHEWPEEKRLELLKLAAQHPALVGIHDLRTRTSGNRNFVQFHIWLDPKMTVREAHNVMDEVEEVILSHFPDIEVLIHPDPEGLVDEDPLAAEDLTAGLPHGAPHEQAPTNPEPNT